MEKVVFFGTSDRSTPILESLKQNFELVLCVTKEDVLVGRHQTPKEVEVKKWAKDNGVNYVTIRKSLKEDAGNIIEHIRTLSPTVGIVADFGFIIPQEIIDVFPKGLVNIHFSLLPKYRGASPVQHTILKMDKTAGISYQLMEYALDKGPILEQLPYPLSGHETSGELYQTLFTLSAEHLPEVLKKYLSGEVTPKPQNESEATYTYSPSHPKTTYVYREDAKIDWKNSAEKISAAIRAYNPWPIAWTHLVDMQDSVDKISGFTKVKDPQHLTKVVKIYSAEVLNTGKLSITQLQMEGGKILSWEQFKNGYLVA